MRLLESPTMVYVGMVSATTAQVGLIIISKKAMASGMTNFIFVAYSNALASVILLPVSLLVHRSPNRPPLTLLLVCGFFSLGVLGCSAQLTGYAGINLTTAAFASAMLNLVPGFTFLLALICRMEKLAPRTSSFLAKTVGTVVAIAGAFVVTLYKGPQILTPLSSLKLNHYYLRTPQSDWVLGGLFLTVDCMASSGYIVAQALILKNYQAELIVVFFYCFFAAILSTVISLIGDRDLTAWSLQPNIRLIAVLYSGVFGSAFQVGVIAWCLNKRGPLFVAMFHPLSIILSAAFGFVFLGDVLYLGSLIGSVTIVIGFYTVMWGKAKEVNIVENSMPRRSSEYISEEALLLPEKN